MSGDVKLYHVDNIGEGILSIMAHPASTGDAATAFSALAAQRVGQVVSLLEASEAVQLGLAREAELARSNDIKFLHFPIADLGSPASIDAFVALARRLYADVHGGVDSVIHCRAGVGRSGLMAAAVLMQDGRDAQQAFARVAKQRGMPLPEAAGQGDWLVAHQAQIRDAVANGRRGAG